MYWKRFPVGALKTRFGSSASRAGRMQKPNRHAVRISLVISILVSSYISYKVLFKTNCTFRPRANHCATLGSIASRLQ